MKRSVLMLFWLAAAATVAAQPASAPTRWTVPRTSAGQPDLEGVWNFAMLTPLERPREFDGREFLTAQEVADLERRAMTREDGRTPHDPQTEPSVHPAWWLDYGKTVGSTRRTSLIVDPPNGRVPPLTADAQRRQAARAAVRRRRGTADGPEDRNLFERCITRGLPVTMLPGPYNNHVQFVQTRDHVLIVTEMIHDVRIVPLEPSSPMTATRTGATRPIRSWLGESTGRWERDTLVVETTHFDEQWVYRGSGPNLRLVERFTRTGPSTIDYRVTMHDADTWSVPWTVALPLTKTEALMYEFACHEGNYGLENILRGARATERARRP